MAASIAAVDNRTTPMNPGHPGTPTPAPGSTTHCPPAFSPPPRANTAPGATTWYNPGFKTIPNPTSPGQSPCRG